VNTVPASRIYVPGRVAVDTIGDARVDIGKGLAVAEATCGVDVVGVAENQLQSGELGVGVE
jgi:hypothetical protein